MQSAGGLFAAAATPLFRLIGRFFFGSGFFGFVFHNKLLGYKINPITGSSASLYMGEKEKNNRSAAKVSLRRTYCLSDGKAHL